MDTEKMAAIRRRVDAVNADLPTVTDIDLLATVAGTDAEMLLDEVAALQARVRALEQYVNHLPGCGYVVKHSTACDCGLMASLAGRQEPARPAEGPGGGSEER